MATETDNKIAEFCQERHITMLMRSTHPVRFHFWEDTEMDLIVDFDPDHVPGYLGMNGKIGLLGIEEELAPLLGKKRVTLCTPEEINPLYRQEALSTAEPLYPTLKNLA